MAKSEETVQEDSAPWATWEELLLACAVNRYGTESWDSVAVEIRKRSSAPIAVTPHNCKSKYLDLKRRFRSVADSDATEGAGDTVLPWLDELRKVRVAELERELQRYDLSIVSLQMKVKRLTEGSENGRVEKSDLQECEEIAKNEEKPELAPATCSPAWAQVVEKHESDGDNQSVNECNGNLQTDEIKLEENETKLVRTEDEGAEPESCSPVRENSCNGSSDSKPVLEVGVKVEPEGDVSESAEHSSASKSKKEGCDTLHCGCRQCDAGEEEGDQCPPALKGNQNQPGGSIVKSQPLIDLLQIVQSHQLGSVFDWRLESQEKSKYSTLIRQHINVKILRTRLEEGYYSEGNDSFFRDVLLLVNNALVFFSKKSPESASAIELRQLISKEMAKTRRNKFTDSTDEKQLSLPPITLPPKQAPELPDSLLLKPKTAGPMIVCRKRSSITAKDSVSTSGADRKKEQKAALAEEIEVLDSKQAEKSSEKLRITKKRTRDSFPSVAKMKQKNVRSDTNSKATEVGSNLNQGKEGSPGKLAETKSEKKNKTSIESDLKKQDATSFLNRMKRSSTSSNGSLLNTFNSSVDDYSENNIMEEQKKGNNRGGGKKDQTPRRSFGGRQMKEQGSPVKRNVGRPPKRAAAPLPVSATTGKRSREVGEVEAVAPKLPNKRSRK